MTTGNLFILLGSVAAAGNCLLDLRASQNPDLLPAVGGRPGL